MTLIDGSCVDVPVNGMEDAAGVVDPVLDRLSGDPATEPDAEALAALREEMLAWARERFGVAFYFATTNAGQDGHSMRVVSIPGCAVPILFHGIWNNETSAIDDVYLLACIGGNWVDIVGLLNDMMSLKDADEATQNAMFDMTAAYITGIIDNFGDIHGLDDVLNLFFYRVNGGGINELPAEGLDGIRPQTFDLFGDMLQAVEEDAQPRLSRPKTDEAREAA